MAPFYTYRTICDMLEEIRNCFKTHNYSPIPGIVEEIQSAANRMESALESAKQIPKIMAERSKKKDELRKIEKEIDKAKKKLDGLKKKNKKAADGK